MPSLHDSDDRQKRRIGEPVVSHDDLMTNVVPAAGHSEPRQQAKTIDQEQRVSEPPTAEDMPATQPPSGTMGYEILGVLGRGGMGVVYKARDLKLKRIVALKMILGGQCREAELVRFGVEVEAVARLRHPNIVQIYSVARHEDRPYFTLELVTGGSLTAWLGGQPLPIQQAAQIVQILARAVHAAHEVGIIHRDLKPANVLLQPAPVGTVDDGGVCVLRGERLAPKLTDFGLARLVDQSNAQTQTGDILGTPSYMAPEQASGQSKNVTRATDVYSLGAIFYELLTGRPPFVADTALDTVLKVLTGHYPTLRLFQPNLPRDLETICEKCLQKEPGKRYTTAIALADDLARFLKQVPIEGRPIGVLEKYALARKQKPALPFLVLLSAAILAAALFVASVWLEPILPLAAGMAIVVALSSFLRWGLRHLVWVFLFGVVSLGIGLMQDVQFAIGMGLGAGVAAWLGATWMTISRHWGQSLFEWIVGASIGGNGACFFTFLMTVGNRWPSELWRSLALSASYLAGSVLGGVIMSILTPGIRIRRGATTDVPLRAPNSTNSAVSSPPGPTETLDYVPPAVEAGSPLQSSYSTQDREPQAEPPPRIGHASSMPQVPGYEMHEMLGKGGMGVVYKARQIATNRWFALKLIQAGRHVDRLAQERFHREARALARLRDPHIVEVYEMGSAGDQFYLVLEYMDGGSLADRLRDHPLPIEEVAPLLEPLARSVHFAHKQGVVHRDLKPQNILRRAEGDYKIADFGLASVEENEPSLTHTGDVLGTPSYMAPEQALGRARDVGPPADIYAFGAILYEILTGRPPFRASNCFALLEQLRTQSPVPPSRLQPACPSILESICLKCLDKNPRLRYESAAALADDLFRYRTGLPTAARPPELWKRALFGQLGETAPFKRLTEVALLFAIWGAAVFSIVNDYLTGILAYAAMAIGPIVAYLIVNFAWAWKRGLAWAPPDVSELILSTPVPWNEVAPIVSAVRAADGWMTISLARLRFPGSCCGCDAPTNEVRLLLISEGIREFSLTIPYCANCQRQGGRRRRTGLLLGMVLGSLVLCVLAVLYGWAHDLHDRVLVNESLNLLYGAAVICGAIVGSIVGFLWFDRFPVRWRHYSWEKGIVELRFELKGYSAKVMARSEACPEPVDR